MLYPMFSRFSHILSWVLNSALAFQIVGHKKVTTLQSCRIWNLHTSKKQLKRATTVGGFDVQAETIYESNGNT